MPTVDVKDLGAISTRALKVLLCERRRVQQSHRISEVKRLFTAWARCFEWKRIILHRKSLTGHVCVALDVEAIDA